MNTRFFLSTIALCAAALNATPATAQADYRLWAFGDSLTIGHGDAGVLCPEDGSPPNGMAGYPRRLDDQLTIRGFDTDVIHSAVCGERTDQGLDRIDTVLGLGGDVVIIMEGTNDVSEGVGFETTLFNIFSMARKVEMAGMEPLVASPIPRGPDSGRGSDNGKNYTIAIELARITAEGNWAYADQFFELFNREDFFEFYFFDQLHLNPAGYSIMASAFVNPAIQAITTVDLCAGVPPGPCVEGEGVLCLNQGRFRLEAVWENFEGQGGTGHAVPQTDDTGAFFWFDPDNIELTIKVLDGRAINGHFWVYYGALSNLKFSLLVTDTETGVCREYFNPLGTFASVGDTFAFFGADIGPPDESQAPTAPEE
ncbi:MAG: GDSL-type esterase/lipase family protein [Acidobacteriota bacterium]